MYTIHVHVYVLSTGWVEVAVMVFSRIVEDNDGVQIARSVAITEELSWHVLVSCISYTYVYMYMYMFIALCHVHVSIAISPLNSIYRIYFSFY